MENQTVTEGKTIAIVSYITFIGTIIAFVMNNEQKNSFASFHIRQMAGLISLQLLSFVVSNYINGTLGWIIFLFAVVLWFIGFLGAIQGQEKRVPLLGDQFQEWFKGIG